MSIRWNKIANLKNFTFGNGNWFFDHLPATRQIFFKRAFGVLSDKSPIRFERTEKGEAIKDKPHHYRDDPLTIEAKQIVEERLRLFADVIYADPSQVIQAVATGRRDLLANSILKRINGSIERIQIGFTQDGSQQPIYEHILGRDPHRLACYEGNPKDIEHVHIEKAIEKEWQRVMNVSTAHERKLAGRDAAYQAAKIEEAAASASTAQSKGGKKIAKAVQVVNKKTQAKRAAVAA